MAFQIQILDGSHTILATASVELCDDLYSGGINLRTMPARVRDVFARYEDIDNDQTLSLLDQIEDEIDDLGLVARIGTDVFRLKDLQIMPSAGTVHFRTVPEPLHV